MTVVTKPSDSLLSAKQDVLTTQGPLPNLAGIATQDLVQQIKSERNNFSASYINWSRTMQLLRDYAPGWLPELVPTAQGTILHLAPQGAFLLIRFHHIQTHETTPAVPQAIMDTRNNAIPVESITARDITDSHRRGVCMAAAFIFGLAYELWAKMPLESGMEVDEEIEKLTADWLAGLEECSNVEELDGYAKKIGESGLPEIKLQKLRAAYMVRKSFLAKKKD